LFNLASEGELLGVLVVTVVLKTPRI